MGNKINLCFYLFGICFTVIIFIFPMMIKTKENMVRINSYILLKYHIKFIIDYL